MSHVAHEACGVDVFLCFNPQSNQCSAVAAIIKQRCSKYKNDSELNKFIFLSLDEKSSIEHQIISILQQIGMNQSLFRFFGRRYSYRLLMNNGIHLSGVHGCFYLHWYVTRTNRFDHLIITIITGTSKSS
jgi:hypothetical protein